MAATHFSGPVIVTSDDSDVDEALGIGVEPTHAFEVMTHAAGLLVVRVPAASVGGGARLLSLVGTGDVSTASTLLGDLRFTVEQDAPRRTNIRFFLIVDDANDERMRLSRTGLKIEVGGISGNADAPLEVETETDTAQQAVTIDQNDADQPFIDFQGTTGATTTATVSTLTTSGATQGHLQIEVNGVKRWIAFVDDPS